MNTKSLGLGCRVLSVVQTSVATFTCVALLVGCASTNTMTNRDLGYSGHHPSRIFIVSNLGKLGDSFEK